MLSSLHVLLGTQYCSLSLAPAVQVALVRILRATPLRIGSYRKLTLAGLDM